MRRLAFLLILSGVIITTSACGGEESLDTSIAENPPATNTDIPLPPTNTPMPIDKKQPTATKVTFDEISTGCNPNNEFPLGLFGSDEVAYIEYEFIEDDKFILHYQGIYLIDGLWCVEGDKLYTVDRGTGCTDLAIYQWTYDGEKLSFESIKDNCSVRRGNMGGKSYQLVEES